MTTRKSLEKKLVMAVIATASMTALASATIDRMVVRQLWPWSTDVQVDFVLTDVTSPVDISVAATDNGQALDLSGRVTGDVYALAEAGTYGLRIKTDGLFDAYRTVADKFRVTLTTGNSDASLSTVLYKIFDLDTGDVEDVTAAKLLSGAYEGVEVTGTAPAPGGAVNVNNIRWCGVTNDEQYATSKLVMRYVKAAGQSFMMGTNVNEMGAFNLGNIGNWDYTKTYYTNGYETCHQVSFTKDYYIGVFEVTQSQYNKMTSSWPSKFSNQTAKFVRPVEQVTYDSITGTFLPALNTKTSATFALPTEAQWEFACRAGTTTGLNNGKDLDWNYRTGGSADIGYGDPAVHEVARWRFNSFVGGGNSSIMDYGASYEVCGTARVGTYLANAWGLYDMHGNVAEWCRDWLKVDLGGASVTDPETTEQTEIGTYRVVRNSGWDYVNGTGCVTGSKRSAFRWGRDPSLFSSAVGFRLMLPVE